jgi:Histidine kinase-, DNA gyrase B-, and HSP90-like ATPase
MPTGSLGVANANPTKEFFVRMLTRDISIEDCILDLIDNSVDAAWESEGGSFPGLEPSERLAPYKVEIDISGDRFQIVDNCRGLSLADATNYAFNFGNRDPREETTFSVGVYGIGMKRAVFKLGRRILIYSTHRKNDGAIDSFQVPIAVDEWLADEDPMWELPIEDAPAMRKAGVKIVVEDLYPEVAASFENPTFRPNLQKILTRDYMLALSHGLTIRVNNRSVSSSELSLRAGEGFQPMRYEYQDGDVGVTIIAGMGRPPSVDASPESSERHTIESGWNIFCNGRAVLANDITMLSGWGVPPTPRWHPQYNGFRGFVFFTSEEPKSLPMTTTKRSVDPSSGLYKRALTHMSQPAREWIDYTNDRKTRLDEARKLERATAPTPISYVRASPRSLLPRLVEPVEPIANINYSRPKKQVRALGGAFGNRMMAYRDVGIKAFELAYELEVDEEDS